jgi:hypothetical protein
VTTNMIATIWHAPANLPRDLRRYRRVDDILSSPLLDVDGC